MRAGLKGLMFLGSILAMVACGGDDRGVSSPDSEDHENTPEHEEAVTPSASLIKNGSLEERAPSGLPDCWQRSQFGENKAVFTQVTDAHEGAFAEKIEITDHANGTGRTLPRLDGGACAPAGVPGKRYTIVGHYKSTRSLMWVLFYRNAEGKWIWWSKSLPLPPAKEYLRSTFTTPPLPAGATHLSFALSMYGSGTLTIDDFSMTEAR